MSELDILQMRVREYQDMMERMNAEIGDLETQNAQMRNAVLEEAAGVCDAKARKIDPYTSIGTMGFASRPAFEEAAKAIRSLKR